MSLIRLVLGNYKKGQYINTVIERPAKVRAAHKGVDLIKRTSMVVRLGIDYDNIKEVQALRLTGDKPQQNQGLKWGTWKEFPYVIEHKGKDYVRMYGNANQIKTKWLLNGVEVDKRTVEHMLLSSELKPMTDEKTLTMTIKSDNIVSIG